MKSWEMNEPVGDVCASCGRAEAAPRGQAARSSPVSLAEPWAGTQAIWTACLRPLRGAWLCQSSEWVPCRECPPGQGPPRLRVQPAKPGHEQWLLPPASQDPQGPRLPWDLTSSSSIETGQALSLWQVRDQATVTPPTTDKCVRACLRVCVLVRTSVCLYVCWRPSVSHACTRILCVPV